MQVAFTAADYHADGVFRSARYAYRQHADGGWDVAREGRSYLRLGPGYRLFTTRFCGICSTDLARQHLPFPLPQITGHEVVAAGGDGVPVTLEINASHRARAVHAGCPFCDSGLDTHCPERLVLGIHDLPGGFAPYVLAPVDAAIPVPAAVPPRAAVLAEPLAAALHGVEMVAPRDGDVVAVLGPRKLGMLVIAALAAYRRREHLRFEIVALVRRDALNALALECGADRVVRTDEAPAGDFADVVFDTSGNPDALPRALRLARREVHLKSTHGQPSAGLSTVTALVVDELAIGRFDADAPALKTAISPRVAWLSRRTPPAWLRASADVRVHADAALLLAQFEAEADASRPARADVAVVDDVTAIDAVVRPAPARQVSLVRPRGTILVAGGESSSGSPLTEAIVARGLTLGTSRCGRLAAALRLMEDDPAVVRLVDRLVTHRFAADRMNDAFAAARSADCLKAVVDHPS